MNSRSGAGEEAAGGSAEELYAWGRRRLLSGASNARLVPDLIERGLPAQMAEYFARHIADQTYSERRAHAVRLALEGSAWLTGALLTLLVIHQTAGTWSGHGPWMLGWAVVACGVLRVLGAMLTLPRSRRGRRGKLACVPRLVTSSPSLVDLQTLGLEREASLAAIHDSYRELAHIWHPDRFGDSAEMRKRAEQRMKQINAAYSRLSRQALEQTS